MQGHRTAQAAGVPSSGGADLRSKLGEPLILETVRCAPHDKERLTDCPYKLRPPAWAVFTLRTEREQKPCKASLYRARVRALHHC